MKIYEFLGIDHLLMDIPIPQEAILENMDEGSCIEAFSAFRYIDYISLRVSLNRDEHYLQVMEIGMNTPRDIDTIARVIQKTIKYRILFIFTYQEHYLILWRNFKLTDSTEYVYTDAITYCTDWIYDESLDIAMLWACNTIKIDGNQTRIVPLSFEKKTKKDDDGMGYFRDVVQNVYSLSDAIINRDLVCSRYLVDWFACHAIGDRVDINYLLSEAIREEMYIIIDDHLFFEKERLEFLCSETDCQHNKYIVNIGRTGRVPWNYFDLISFPATYEEEYEIISRLHMILDSDSEYLLPLLSDHDSEVPAMICTKFFEQDSQVTLIEPPGKSDAQQIREEEYQATVEQEFDQKLEVQRTEEAQSQVEAQYKVEEELHFMEDRRNAEEALRRAEEEYSLAEKRSGVEEFNHQAEEQKKVSSEPIQEIDALTAALNYIEFAKYALYFEWLSTKVSGEYFNEIIKAYAIIRKFVVANNLLDAPLLETIDIFRVRDVQDAVRFNKEFTNLGGNSRYFCGLAMRHYLQYVSELKRKNVDVEQEENCRLAEAHRKIEDKHQEDARCKAEEEARRKAEEERRLAEERRKAEESKRQEEARLKAEEEACRKAEEERRLAEERRKAEESKRQEEARLKAKEEARCKAEVEVRRIADEVRRLIEARRKAEELRLQEEVRLKAEEAYRLIEEEKRMQEEKRAQYRRNNRCQHCGGEFKAILGVFAKKCKVCKKPKDY